MARIWVKTEVSRPQDGYGQWERHSVADQLVKVNHCSAGGLFLRRIQNPRCAEGVCNEEH